LTVFAVIYGPEYLEYHSQKNEQNDVSAEISKDVQQFSQESIAALS